MVLLQRGLANNQIPIIAKVRNEAAHSTVQALQNQVDDGHTKYLDSATVGRVCNRVPLGWHHGDVGALGKGLRYERPTCVSCSIRARTPDSEPMNCMVNLGRVVAVD